MNIEKYIKKEMYIDEFFKKEMENNIDYGCLFVNSDPKEYGLTVENLMFSKRKKKNDILGENIISNMIMFLNDFNEFTYNMKFEDEEEKEIVLEKPLYFLNILGISNFNFEKKKVALNLKNIKTSQDITNYFENNYNICSTEYMNPDVKSDILKFLLSVLYVENPDTNKKNVIYFKENISSLYKKISCSPIIDWFITYKVNNNPFQLKYIIKCETLTKNFIFLVGVDKSLIFESVEQNFDHIKNLLINFQNYMQNAQHLIKNNKDILLDIKNININNVSFINETLCLNENYYYYKYDTLLNNISYISETNIIKCISNGIYYYRYLMRNIYFIILFSKYLEYFIKYFNSNVKIYNINNFKNIQEVNIEELYKNYYYKLYNYIHNLFLFDRTLFNYDTTLKKSLETVYNKYNIV